MYAKSLYDLFDCVHVVCPAGSYGAGCLQNCTCVPEQESSSCDHIDGTCYCLPGYNGSSCELGKLTSVVHKITMMTRLYCKTQCNNFIFFLHTHKSV